jgi:protein-S-isoprenylcysteine O-methyltransferase Ste14
MKKLDKRKKVFLIFMLTGSLSSLVAIYFKETNNSISRIFSVIGLVLLCISLIITLSSIKIIKR